MTISRQSVAGAGAALATAALGAGLLVGSAERGSTAAPSPERCTAAQPPLAVHGRWDARRLADLDPLTLEPAERGVALRGQIWGSDRSPDGGAVAIGVGTRSRLQIVDLRRQRSAGSMRLGGRGPVVDVVWAASRRIVARVGSGAPRPQLVVVDLQRRRVLSRRILPGQVQAAEPIPGGLAVVTGPGGRIGAAQLVLARADGSMRTVTLERIAAGFVPPPTHRERGQPAVARLRQPALAVDADGRRALVVAAGAPLVALVDVDSGEVEYTELEEPRSVGARLRDWIEPPAHAKVSEGSRRVAYWLGDGLLAISGTDSEADPESPERAYGLRIADIDDGTLRTAAENVDFVQFAAGMLVVSRPEAIPVLAAYDGDGSRRWLHRHAEGFIQLRIAGCRAYLGSRRALHTLDLRNGRVLYRGPRQGELPLLLGG